MKKLLLVLFAFPYITHAQNITTYIGSGVSGFSGDGGLADTAKISEPMGLSFDNSGSLIVSHAILVRRVDKLTNIITTIAGSDTASSLGHGGDGGPATCALIIGPFSTCVDATGNYYIADNWYGEVRKVDITTNIIDTFAGNRNPGNTGDGGPAKSASFIGVIGVSFDAAHHYLYIADEFNYRIRKVDMATGIISAFAGTGINSFSGDNGPAINAAFSRILGMCMDVNNNLYIGDWDNHRIRRVDGVTGIVTTIAGNGNGGFSGDGDLATNAGLGKPSGICLDKCGNLYFSDEDNNRVRRIDMITGIINAIAGNGTAGFSGDGGPALGAQFNAPTGLAIDSSGNLYISDFNNNRVRKITFPPPFVTLPVNAADTVCAGHAVTLQATTAIAGSAPSFQWFVNGVQTAVAGGAYTYLPTNGDTVSCILTSSSACVGTPTVVSNTIHIVVDTLIVPAIAINGITAAPLGATVTLTATVTDAGSAYAINWFNNGVHFNTTTTPSVSYTKAAGTDNITARVYSFSPGCYDSAGSAVHVVTQSTTGFNSLAVESKIIVYPNPANDVLHIDGISADNKQAYSILSIVGVVIQQGSLKEGNNSIPIQSLPAGVYVMEITGSEGERIVSKIIKQ